MSPSPGTILNETRLLLERLEVASDFVSDHVFNLLPLHGKLPEEKGRMIRMVEDALRGLEDDLQLKEEMELRRHLTRL